MEGWQVSEVNFFYAPGGHVCKRHICVHFEILHRRDCEQLSRSVWHSVVKQECAAPPTLIDGAVGIPLQIPLSDEPWL